VQAPEEVPTIQMQATEEVPGIEVRAEAEENLLSDLTECPIRSGVHSAVPINMCHH
jgi:hypothetical protein